jgi:ABC-2 type transport system permease protein
VSFVAIFNFAHPTSSQIARSSVCEASKKLFASEHINGILSAAMALVLLRPQYLIIKNRLFGPTKSPLGKRRELLLFGVAALIMGSIFGAVYLLFRGIASEPAFVILIPRKMIDMVYAYFFILLILSNTVAATGNIYSSEMLQLIMQAPVGKFRIYLAKYLETFLETAFMFFVLTTPAALAYVIQLKLSWYFLPIAFLVSVLFLLIPVGLGIAIATLVARLIALVWKRGGVLLLGIILAFIGSSFQLANQLERVQKQKAGQKALAQMMGLYSDNRPLLLPSNWAADIVGSFLNGNSEGNTERWILLVSAVGISFAVGYFVFAALFLRVRSSAHTMFVSDGSSKPRDILRNAFDGFVSLFPVDPQIRAIIVKDLSGMVRDRAQALQLLLYLGVGALYITVHSFMTTAMTLSSTAKEVWIGLLASTNVLLVGLMTTTLLTRLVYPSVSLEGRAFWIMQVTPISVRKVIRAKLYCWMPFTALLCGTLMLVGSYAIDLGIGTSLLVFLIGISISSATTGLSVGLGSKYANFDWDSPSQLTVGLGTLALLLLSVLTVFAFSIPSTILLFILIVPAIHFKLGTVLALSIEVVCLWSILFGAFYLARSSTRNGAKALQSRLSEV